MLKKQNSFMENAEMSKKEELISERLQSVSLSV